MKRAVAALCVGLVGLLGTPGVDGSESPQAPQAPQARTPSPIPWRLEIAAVRSELSRGVEELRLADRAQPYVAQAHLLRAETLTLDGSYGGVITDLLTHSARGRVDVRVGSPRRDNSGFMAPSGVVDIVLPIQSDAHVTRRAVWLAMDSAFRDASTAFSAKETIISRWADENLPPSLAAPPPTRNQLDWGQLDWGQLPTAQLKPGKASAAIDRQGLRRLAAELSRRFSAHPDIDNGDVIIDVMTARKVLVSNENVTIGRTFQRAVLAIVADTRAADGMHLDHGGALHFQRRLVANEDLRTKGSLLVDRVLNELEALAAAPMLDEDYDGPILFSPQASAQLLASTVALHASGSPAPLSDLGPVAKLEPHWQKRLGKPVFPRFLDLVDDPRAGGFGSYSIDDQGMPAARVQLVQRGILRELLMTRQPNKYVNGSNGRARMGPSLRLEDTAISNLRVVSRKRGLSTKQLERELLRRAREDGSDFAYVVEDFRDASLLGPVPRESASVYADSRKVVVPLPARIFRIDAQGTKTLVRGGLFAPFSMRVFRRVRAVGRDSRAFPLRIVPGPTGGWAAAIGLEAVLHETVDVQVDTPALLIDGFELLVEHGEHERLPILVHPLREPQPRANADTSAGASATRP